MGSGPHPLTPSLGFLLCSLCVTAVSHPAGSFLSAACRHDAVSPVFNSLPHFAPFLCFLLVLKYSRVHLCPLSPLLHFHLLLSLPPVSFCSTIPLNLLCQGQPVNAVFPTPKGSSLCHSAPVIVATLLHTLSYLSSHELQPSWFPPLLMDLSFTVCFADS